MPRRTPAETVFDFFDTIDEPAGRLTDECAFPFQRLDQVLSDMPELGGEILVDVNNVHWRPFVSRVEDVVNDGTGRQTRGGLEQSLMCIKYPSQG